MNQCPETPDLKLLYREMLRIRMVEETIAEQYHEQEMRCPVHLSIGQEASAVGICAALTSSDQILSTHRSHAHYLAKGGNLNAMMAEIYGKETGCCGGRGGSMYLFDSNAGVLLSLPIVASSISIGVGAALAMQQENHDFVSVVFMGDASVEEGVFHESANFASLKKLPVLFICENNLFSVYTNLSDRQPARPITKVAEAHDIPSAHLDGNNVAQVFEHAADAVERARNGEGPTFLQLDTYRWREHCGPEYDNHLGYRQEEEFLSWKERCPVAQLQKELISLDQLTEKGDQVIRHELQAEIDAAIENAKAASFPKVQTAAGRVYA